MLDFVSDIHTTSVGATSTAGSILPVKVSRDGFNRWPVWSPDGKRIAYVRVPTTGRELSVLDLASGAEQRIPNVARDRAQVCWAGNDAIVWRRLKEGLKELEFRRYTLSTQTDALLFEEPVQDAVGFGCSYDGTTVVYVNPATRMLTVRTVNGIKREALALPAGAALNSETFALSPNGEELALFVTPPAERTTSLIVLRLATGERRQIAQAKPGDRFSRAKGVAWSRDGKFLLYAQGNESSEEFELIRVEASGGIAQRLGIRAEGLSDLDVGPNGTIAFRAGPMDMPQVVAIENVSIPAK
jgi:dipeptidyl aminopeptidase/acylaminoacyl peptidase